MGRPALWVGCLAAYNEGHLHGEWIYPADYADGDEMWEDIKARILDTSPALFPEELQINDYEYWAGYKPDPYSLNCDFYVKLATAIEDGDSSFKAAIQVAHNEDMSISGEEFLLAADYIHENRYYGFYTEFQDFAEELAQMTIQEIPEAFRDFVCQYFDTSKYARDLEHEFIPIQNEESTGVFIFHNE